MNREIEFRGLRVDGKGWVYGYYNFNPLLNRAEIYSYDNYRSYVFEVESESVGQFTGRHDKLTKKLEKTNKIFEGDILKYHKNTSKWLVTIVGEVIFEGGAFYLYWERDMLGKKEVHKDLLTRYERRYLKVIGNKFD